MTRHPLSALTVDELARVKAIAARLGDQAIMHGIVDIGTVSLERSDAAFLSVAATMLAARALGGLP